MFLVRKRKSLKVLNPLKKKKNHFSFLFFFTGLLWHWCDFWVTNMIFSSMQSLSSHLADDKKDLLILYLEKEKKRKKWHGELWQTYFSLFLFMSSPRRSLTESLLSFMVLLYPHITTGRSTICPCRHHKVENGFCPGMWCPSLHHFSGNWRCSFWL